MAFGLFGSFLSVPGGREDLAACLLQAAELLRTDPDCLLYVVGTTEQPDEVAVSEVWTDEAAHAASLHREGVPELIARARPLIAGVAGQTRLTVLGGKGL